MADEIVLTDEQTAEVQQKVDEAILNAESANPDISEEERTALETKTRGEATASLKQEDMSWLHKDKYGDDENIAMKKQAKAYDSAVREMQKKQQEANDYKRRLEELENNSTVGKPPTEEEYPEEFKRKLEEKYGNEYTFNQLRALDDIVSSRLNPLAEIIFNSQAETVKNNFAKNKYYEKYKDVVDMRLQKLSLSERVNPQKIQETINNVIVEKFPEIIAEERENALKELTGHPVNKPSVEGGGGNLSSLNKKKLFLSKAQREYSFRTGSNPDELEKWLGEKETQKKTGWGQYIE